MKRIMGDAYDGFVKFVDNFANCTSADEEKKEVVSVPVSVKPDYEYPSDNYLDGPLNNFAAKKILRKLASDYYGRQVEEIVENGIKLSAEGFPRLWSNFEHCAKRLASRIIRTPISPIS